MDATAGRLRLSVVHFRGARYAGGGAKSGDPDVFCPGCTAITGGRAAGLADEYLAFQVAAEWEGQGV